MSLTKEEMEQRLQKYVGEFNDSITRSEIAHELGVLCNDELNTPEIIETNAIRFELDGKIYEFGPSNEVTNESILGLLFKATLKVVVG